MPKLTYDFSAQDFNKLQRAVGDALNLMDTAVTPAVRRNATKAEVDAFLGGYIIRLTKNADRLRDIRNLPEPADISLTPE
jgi:hypothetical protein